MSGIGRYTSGEQRTCPPLEAATGQSEAWALAAFIVVLGATASIIAFLTLRGNAEEEARAHLEATGDELIRVASDVESIVLQQVLSIEGLYESSLEVTKQEFDHFASVTGSHDASDLGFAARVPIEEVDAYLAGAREDQPDYEITALDEDANVIRGAKVGWSVGSDPLDRESARTRLAGLTHRG